MNEEKRVASVFDLVRMCKYFVDNCGECPLNRRIGPCPPFDYSEEDNKAILKWCDEHPTKTYLQDFFEKYPNAKRSPISPDLPTICRYSLYRCDSSEYIFCREMYCAKCWNEVMPEEETK